MEQNDTARSADILFRYVAIELERSDQYVDVWYSNLFDERGPKYHTGSTETHAEVKSIIQLPNFGSSNLHHSQ